MKDTVIVMFSLLVFITPLCAQDKPVVSEAELNSNEIEETNPPKLEENFDDLFDRLNLDSVLSHPDQPHLPATEELQRLINDLENLKVTDYNDNFEEHHLDFIDLEAGL